MGHPVLGWGVRRERSVGKGFPSEDGKCQRRRPRPCAGAPQSSGSWKPRRVQPDIELGLPTRHHPGTMTIPNIITIARLVMVPIVIVMIMQERWAAAFIL